MKYKFLNIGLIVTSTLATTFGLVSCDPKNKTTTDGKLSNNNNDDSKYEPLAPGAHISKLSLNDLMVYSSSNSDTSIGDLINRTNESYLIYKEDLYVKNYLIWQKQYVPKNFTITDKIYHDILNYGNALVYIMWLDKNGKTPRNEWTGYFKDYYESWSPYYKYFKNSSIRDKISLDYGGTKIQWV